MKNRFWLPLAFALTLIVGIVGGWILANKNRAEGRSVNKLLDVLNYIHEEYVDELPMDSLVELTIPELLKNLDPHSSYIPARDLTQVNSELDGKFSGIGISFQIFNDTLSIVEIISGGPAEKVGLIPGDRILKVDDKEIAGIGLKEDDVFSLLRGPKGSKVVVTVKRHNSSKPLEFELVRDDIPVESIDAAYMLNDSVGYVKVARFGRNTYEDFMKSLATLALDGATSFVVDLRNNGGGYMEPAVLMVNEFLPAGKTIVSTRGRNSYMDQNILSDGSGAFQDYDLVVMINEFSASASEIFSGAVQDNDRGWIVGRRSFGKGLVQSPILLPDSSEIRLTTQRYYTPTGRSIQKAYKLGAIAEYENELINRFNNGEILSADSIKLNIDQVYTTPMGRKVYGGGGIMPDYFVPNDTSNVTSYYINVSNQGLLNKYAYEYTDENRQSLSKARDVDQLLGLLPSDGVLLQDFVRYAVTKGVPARWYYINISAPLIVNQLKGLIARNVLGIPAYYEVVNVADQTLDEAIRHIGKPFAVESTN